MADKPNVNMNDYPEGYDGVWNGGEGVTVDNPGVQDETTPAEETPTEDTTATDNTPVTEETTTDTTLPEETPTEDTPSDDVPTDSNPVTEDPALEETPAEETPAEDSPVSDTQDDGADKNTDPSVTVTAGDIDRNGPINEDPSDTEGIIAEDTLVVEEIPNTTPDNITNELTDVVTETDEKTEKTTTETETKTETETTGTETTESTTDTTTTTDNEASEDREYTAEEKAAAWAIWRDGEYGNGQERIDNLTEAGLDASNVQSYVDGIASGKYTYAEYLEELEAAEKDATDTVETEDEATTDTEAENTDGTDDSGNNNNDEDTTEKGDSEDKFHNFVQTMIWKAEELGIPVASIAEKFGVNLEEHGYTTEVPENTDSLYPEDETQTEGEQTEGEDTPQDETQPETPTNANGEEPNEEQTEGEDTEGEQTEGEEEQTEGEESPADENQEEAESEPLAWETDDYANQMKSKIDWAYNASDAPNASIHGIQSGTAQDDYRNAVASFRETHTQSWMYSDDELAAMPADQVDAIKLKELQIMSDWSDDKNKDVPTSVNSYADYQNMESIKAENAAIQSERTGYLQNVAENSGYVFPTLDEATAKSIMGEDVYNDYAAQMQDFYAEQQTETEDTATKTDAEVEATQTDAQPEATETDATKSSGPYANETANNEWAKAQAQKRGAEADAELGTDDMLASDTDATLSNDREAE